MYVEQYIISIAEKTILGAGFFYLLHYLIKNMESITINLESFGNTLYMVSKTLSNIDKRVEKLERCIEKLHVKERKEG